MIGVVLAGGQSSRLGYDKTTVIHEGQTLLARAAALLGRHCHPVYISCRHPENLPLHLPVITDQTERIGPLGGILSALRTVGGPILALACDLPFLEDRFIARLIAAHSTRPAHCVMTTWLQQETGFIEALVAIYEVGAMPFLEQGMAKGAFKLSRLVPEDLRHCLAYGPEDAEFFFNVNFPKDLERISPSRTR